MSQENTSTQQTPDSQNLTSSIEILSSVPDLDEENKKDNMKKSMKQLNEEIHRHSRKGIALMREGQEIHQEYQAAPESQDLAEQLTALTKNQGEADAELHTVTELQEEYMNRQRAEIAQTLKDLHAPPSDKSGKP